MQLDIRIPIGLLFGIIGAILAVLGLWTKYVDPNADPLMYERSLGYNVNLLWGAVLLVFAVLMLLLARRAAKRDAAG